MRILFVCNPLRGHLNTLLPLALAAQRAGHAPAIASGVDMRPAIERHGLAAWPVGPTHAQLGGGRQASWLDYFARSAAGRAAELVARARQWQPDLVVHEDTEFAGALAAAHCGAPAVVHGLGLMPSPEVWAAFSARLDEFGKAFGVADLAARVRDAEYLHVCPPALQRRGAPVWPRALALRHGTGMAAAGERLPHAVDALPLRESIHLTLGTVFHEASGVLQSAIAGLRKLPFNLVVTSGPDSDPAGLGAQPRQVFVAPYLPHALLLPRCRLVVSHGGAGAMLGALGHGLPQLLLPQGGDQFANARACVDAGVALALPAQQVTPARVGKAARRLLADPAFTTAARAVQAEIAAMPSARQRLRTLAKRVAAQTAGCLGYP